MQPAVDICYSRSPHTAWQIMPEGGMILHLRAHELTATNTTGAAIWQELEKPQTAQQLSETLSARFEVSPAEALGTVQVFLADLRAKGLVDIVSSNDSELDV